MKIQKTLDSGNDIIVESGKPVVKKRRKVVFKPYYQNRDFLLQKSL